MKTKTWTGERLETHIFSETATEHLHRYAIASKYVKNKIVLDIASGEGYGSNILAQKAEQVYGVDISAETVKLASLKYVKSNLIFKQGSTSLIPLKDNAVDVVVSFETIEHHNQHHEMMQEIKRVLKPNGVLIISTPDKKNYSDKPQAVNPHHVKELYIDEFKTLIKKYFVNTDFFYQKIFTGSIIKNENTKNDIVEFTGNYEGINQKSDFEPIYILCIASDAQIVTIENSMFDGSFMALNQRNELINNIKKSWSYRIGNFLLYPFSVISNLLKLR